MKPILIAAFIFFSTNATLAQPENPDFTFGIVVPDANGDLSQVQLQKLASKMTQIINGSHQAMVGYYNDFEFYPTVSVEESSVVEGGMQNISVTTLDLSFSVMQISTGIVFNSINKKIKGSGNNQEQAITNAISKINPSDNSYVEFISITKDKIFSYYNNNCNSIIQKASTAVSENDYEEALSLLESIPETAPCAKEAEKKSKEVYAKYQRAFCAKAITRAKSAMAVKDYYLALAELDLIEPSSNCAKEANKLISDISAKVNVHLKKAEDMEKLRINAIKEIAVAYFSKKAKSKRH